MRPLGTVVNFSPRGSIIIRSEIAPRIGQVVCDNRGTPLGKVIRITGPVSRPYIMVSALAKDEVQMFRIGGKKVFLDDGPRQPDRRPHRERSEPTRPRSGGNSGERPKGRPWNPPSFKGKGYNDRDHGKNSTGQRPPSRDRRKKTRY
ncbi:MAG: hypothetical protein JXA22_01860 [Candidatus Thermoplasmatota archaeon]|nr:hypothetical protein [Candidatus Thermoplasmatota archaeon]